MDSIEIKIDKIYKKYPSSAQYSLKDVSLNIYKGEVIGIMGPNGAGKTTLISILCQLLPFNSGSVEFFENNKILLPKKIKQKIGFIPQELALFEELTAFQNVEYFGALYNLNKKEIIEKSTKLFEVLGLLDVAHRKVKTFSGGMKRRLNIIIGVIHNPEILFLDEPTVGVDIHSRNAILTFLKTINKKKTTIIYTSHHLEEAEQLCDRIAIIDNGEIVAIDVVSNLLSKYSTNNLTELLLKLTGKELRDNV